MKAESIGLCHHEGLQLCYDFLIKKGINAVFPKETDGVFNRDLHLFINSTEYIITWYINESTLWLGEKNVSAFIKFKHIYVDTTYPIIGGNRSIVFSYTKNERKNIFDREFPYDSLLIPIIRR